MKITSHGNALASSRCSLSGVVLSSCLSDFSIDKFRHQLNCPNAGLEDSAYIVSRNPRKGKHVQLSEFIF